MRNNRRMTVLRLGKSRTAPCSHGIPGRDDRIFLAPFCAGFSRSIARSGNLWPFARFCARPRRRAANHWPLVAIKGLLAIAIGVAGLTIPAPALSALVLAFALYCFADGVCSAVLASHHAVSGTRWAWQAVTAIVALVAGAAAVIYPAMEMAAFLRLLTAWSLLSGLTSVLAAFRLENDHGRGWLVGSGVALLFVAIVTGAALPLAPAMAMRSIATGILVAGLLLGGLALQLRAHRPGSSAADRTNRHRA